MGVHYPFGYVGYETACLRTAIDLLDAFCGGCHTNDDVMCDCSKCEVGALVLKCKAYMLDAYESPHNREEVRILRRIKKLIKPIKPHPGFHSTLIFEDARKVDKVEPLQRALKDLEFQNTRWRWTLALNYQTGLLKRMAKEKKIFNRKQKKK